MAIFNFTTSGSTYTLLIDGVSKGTWDKVDEIDNPHSLKTNDELFQFTLQNPYYGNRIKASDVIQVNGVSLTGSLSAKVVQLKDNVFYNPGVSLSDAVGIVYTKTTILTDAQIKTLPTTPVVILPAAGVNKLITINQVVVISNIVAPYTNVSALDAYLTPMYANYNEVMSYLLNQNGGLQRLTQMLSSNKIAVFSPNYPNNSFGVAPITYATGTLPNQAISLIIENAGSGNLTGGNAANTLKAIISYAIIDVS